MTLCEIRYESRVLDKDCTAFVSLPEPGAPGPYPVVFLLHGLSGDHSNWVRKTSVERYVRDLPVILVMPDGGRSFYCDAAEGAAWGTALGVELPELVRHWFPTRPGWGIAGLSMGGYGALRLALTYPETFRAAASLSGALAFGHWYGWDPSEDFGREFRRVLGPDPMGGPNDLFHLVAAARDLPALWLDCGDQDFLLPSNRGFRDHLTALGLPHHYSEHPGDHNWAYWDEHIQPALEFLRGPVGF